MSGGASVETRKKPEAPKHQDRPELRNVIEWFCGNGSDTGSDVANVDRPEILKIDSDNTLKPEGLLQDVFKQKDQITQSFEEIRKNLKRSIGLDNAGRKLAEAVENGEIGLTTALKFLENLKGKDAFKGFSEKLEPKTLETIGAGLAKAVRDGKFLPNHAVNIINNLDNPNVQKKFIDTLVNKQTINKTLQDQDNQENPINNVLSFSEGNLHEGLLKRIAEVVCDNSKNGEIDIEGINSSLDNLKEHLPFFKTDVGQESYTQLNEYVSEKIANDSLKDKETKEIREIIDVDKLSKDQLKKFIEKYSEKFCSEESNPEDKAEAENQIVKTLTDRALSNPTTEYEDICEILDSLGNENISEQFHENYLSKLTPEDFNDIQNLSDLSNIIDVGRLTRDQLTSLIEKINKNDKNRFNTLIKESDERQLTTFVEKYSKAFCNGIKAEELTLEKLKEDPLHTALRESNKSFFFKDKKYSNGLKEFEKSFLTYSIPIKFEKYSKEQWDDKNPESTKKKEESILEIGRMLDNLYRVDKKGLNNILKDYIKTNYNQGTSEKLAKDVSDFFAAGTYFRSYKTNTLYALSGAIGDLLKDGSINDEQKKQYALFGLKVAENISFVYGELLEGGLDFGKTTLIKTCVDGYLDIPIENGIVDKKEVSNLQEIRKHIEQIPERYKKERGPLANKVFDKYCRDGLTVDSQVNASFIKQLGSLLDQTTIKERGQYIISFANTIQRVAPNDPTFLNTEYADVKGRTPYTDIKKSLEKLNGDKKLETLQLLAKDYSLNNNGNTINTIIIKAVNELNFTNSQKLRIGEKFIEKEFENILNQDLNESILNARFERIKKFYSEIGYQNSEKERAQEVYVSAKLIEALNTSSVAEDNEGVIDNKLKIIHNKIMEKDFHNPSVLKSLALKEVEFANIFSNNERKNDFTRLALDCVDQLKKDRAKFSILEETLHDVVENISNNNLSNNIIDLNTLQRIYDMTHDYKINSEAKIDILLKLTESYNSKNLTKKVFFGSWETSANLLNEVCYNVRVAGTDKQKQRFITTVLCNYKDEKELAKKIIKTLNATNDNFNFLKHQYDTAGSDDMKKAFRKKIVKMSTADNLNCQIVSDALQTIAKDLKRFNLINYIPILRRLTEYGRISAYALDYAERYKLREDVDNIVKNHKIFLGHRAWNTTKMAAMSSVYFAGWVGKQALNFVGKVLSFLEKDEDKKSLPTN